MIMNTSSDKKAQGKWTGKSTSGAIHAIDKQAQRNEKYVLNKVIVDRGRSQDQNMCENREEQTDNKATHKLNDLAE